LGNVGRFSCVGHCVPFRVVDVVVGLALSVAVLSPIAVSSASLSSATVSTASAVSSTIATIASSSSTIAATTATSAHSVDTPRIRSSVEGELGLQGCGELGGTGVKVSLEVWGHTGQFNGSGEAVVMDAVQKIRDLFGGCDRFSSFSQA
jgi:hypothetical protein